jgi:peptidoglycan/LPS O-acetylase OafA/YrhL
MNAATDATSGKPRTGRDNRLASLDQGRFAACWYVMLFHASIDVRLVNGVLSQGFAGVQFFMMLSGYVLARPYLESQPARPFDLRRYALGRITRIVPPYYVVVLLAAALALLGSGSTSTPIPRADLGWHVVAHLAFVHTFFASTYLSLVSVLWSLGLEWQYYLVLPLLLRAFRVRRPLLVFVATVLLTASTRILLRSYLPARGELENGFFLARLTEFSAGVMIATLLGRGWSRRSLLLLAALLGGCGLLTIALGGSDREFAVQGAVLLLFVVLRLYGPAVARGRLSRGLSFLGEASYSTYLVHTLAGKAALTVLAHLAFAVGKPWTQLVLYTTAGQIAGVCFYFAVEKPTTRWAAQLLGNRREAASTPSAHAT